MQNTLIFRWQLLIILDINYYLRIRNQLTSTFLVNLVKCIVNFFSNFRLDKILGSAKAKDCYDSSTVSLASRIVKVERQVTKKKEKKRTNSCDFSCKMKTNLVLLRQDR